ncbi:hypothetical protein ACFOZ7_16140 [Natribaculum luteum]|uniref:Uncharacterized protein n=1 Tax=Natribaculum luteum TaxID=1586232 RepID=A0ABD5P339_9EURY
MVSLFTDDWRVQQLFGRKPLVILLGRVFDRLNEFSLEIQLTSIDVERSRVDRLEPFLESFELCWVVNTVVELDWLVFPFADREEFERRWGSISKRV